MARIRTIKPEFPQSESMGRVSRDARLLFVMLWTIVDDRGRTRAASRMLASLLFPYDDDAALRIPEWLMELEREKCVRVYAIDGNTYLQIEKWLDHQRIDHPSKSKFPNPPERIVKARETLGKALPVSGPGPRTKDQGLDQGPKDQDDTSADADRTPAEAIDAYNTLARELDWPEARQISAQRQRQLKARLRDCAGIAGWNAAMARARASPFLRGETARDKAHENWVPDIDFFLSQKSFTKLMEGKYDQRDSRSQPTGFDALRAGARRAAGLDARQGPGVEPEQRIDPLNRLASPEELGN